MTIRGSMKIQKKINTWQSLLFRRDILEYACQIADVYLAWVIYGISTEDKYKNGGNKY